MLKKGGTITSLGIPTVYPLPPHRYPPHMARVIGPPRNRDPPRRSRAGAGEGQQWCKAIVVCRVSELTSQVKSSQDSICMRTGRHTTDTRSPSWHCCRSGGTRCSRRTVSSRSRRATGAACLAGRPRTSRGRRRRPPAAAAAAWSCQGTRPRVTGTAAPARRRSCGDRAVGDGRKAATCELGVACSFRAGRRTLPGWTRDASAC